MAQELYQAKLRFCKTHPFIGLSALGMWYGRIVKAEIRKWEVASRTAAMGKAKEMAALCENQGYHLRKVLTDGKLLEVYQHGENNLREATLLPIALLGNQMQLIKIADIPKTLAAKGGFRAEVEIGGFPRRGWFLPGRFYNAFWSDEGIAYHSENPGAPNPNTENVRRL